MKLIDISPPISPATAVWPGDIPFSRKVQMDCSSGDHLTLSSITTTLHIGAHADAPSHYAGSAPAIDEVDLIAYYGRCRVVSVAAVDRVIRPEHCATAVRDKYRRILFRTGSQADFVKFNRDFAWFAPEAIEFMGKAGVLLVGIDTASVDPFDSKELPAHQMLWKYRMRNLEGLLLSAVRDGDYLISAFPLNLVGADASPVRAVLIADDVDS